MQKLFKVFKFYKFIGFCLIINLHIFSTACAPGRLSKDRADQIDYKKAALLNVDLGRHYLSQGYTERAKKKFLHALDLMPNLAETHSGMAYFWETVGEYQEAEKHYKKSINLGKGNGFFYNQYAAFLCGRDNYHKADHYFMLAVKDKLYTKTAEVYANAGLCALKYDNNEKATKYFTKALDHDPKRLELLLELAKLSLSKASDTKEQLSIAKSYLDQFYQQNTKPTALYLWLRIKLAKLAKQEDQIASYALMLKNLFADSVEYNMYRQEYGQV